MPFIGISITGPRQPKPGLFIIGYRHRDYGKGRVVLDEETLRPMQEEITVPSEFPRALTAPALPHEGIRVRLATDLGEASGKKHEVRYVLRWETLGAHHDRPRKPPLPPPSILKLVKLELVR